MDEGPEQIKAEEVSTLIANALAQLQEPAQVRADGVWLLNWPSVRISLGRALAYRAAPDGQIWTAWVDLTCMYNTALPSTAAKTHVIGFGLDRTAAISDAVDNWRKGIAPALISYIYGVLVADADTWAAGDARAPSGWSCISGPYVLHGNQASVDTLGAFLQQEPMIGPVRERLAATLDTGASIHTISLYRAQTASGNFADVLIDNDPDAVAGELLKSMRWPKELANEPFVAARHFLLCIAPNAAPDGHAAHARLDDHQEQARSRNRRILVAIAFLALATAFSYVLHNAFVGLTALLAPKADGAIFTLVPVTPFWWAPASVLGSLLSGAVVWAAIFLRDRRAPAAGQGPRVMPVRLIALCIFLAALMGLATIFAVRSNLQLMPDEIVLRRMWSFGIERYPYSRVVALIEEGEPGRRGSSFSIHLKDAPAWSTRQEVIFPGSAEKQYLAKRTGLEIQHMLKP
ncbi:MAG: hypothetical protein K2Y71_15850 [Xanthobacteraceae bacterium]|nr:hypothetical protein [Xanthobacteraceae bacterium]